MMYIVSAALQCTVPSLILSRPRQGVRRLRQHQKQTNQIKHAYAPSCQDNCFSHIRETLKRHKSGCIWDRRQNARNCSKQWSRRASFVVPRRQRSDRAEIAAAARSRPVPRNQKCVGSCSGMSCAVHRFCVVKLLAMACMMWAINARSHTVQINIRHASWKPCSARIFDSAPKRARSPLVKSHGAVLCIIKAAQKFTQPCALQHAKLHIRM